MALNVFQSDADSNSQIDTHIAESVDQKAKAWALNGAWVLISVILGYMIATVWDLNGKIYEVAGKQEIQYDVIDKLKEEINEAEGKIKSLSSEKNTLNKENYKLREELAELNHKNNLLSLQLETTKVEK